MSLPVSPPSGFGVSGRIAKYFQAAQITPLLALVALLLGLFAVVVTPREEEPQINVTMADVMVPFPGASARDVEQTIAGPAEQVLSQIAGVEHVSSVSSPGMAVVTVQFKVGVPRTEALVRLHDTVQANQDWLPRNLGALLPIVKPKGIDDVPIVTVTLYSAAPGTGAFELGAVAHSVEADIKRVPGTREVSTLGDPRRAINIAMDAARMAAADVSVGDIRRALQSANAGSPVGSTINDNHSVLIDSGPFLHDARDVGAVVVGVKDGKPIALAEVAAIDDGPVAPDRYVWYGSGGKGGGAEHPAVTISVTKKAGTNAVTVADAVVKRIEELRNAVIPAGVQIAVTRNYGATADEKALKLIEKLILATASVVGLVFLALGRREAAIVGAAVVLTLTATLFASWAWGFTLNRVSLFALIFSIGILVDDAIVVVENIHRHKQLEPGRPLADIIPGAVDEVGGPTILATLTVIAALLPMAFVSGLMGPYMSPIPINASMGMLISLTVAFVVTPWLARLWLTSHQAGFANMADRLAPLLIRVYRPFLDGPGGRRNRSILWVVVAILVGGSVALPVAGRVVLKMLPFDNKSEFQIVADLPTGTPVERSAALLHELGAFLSTVPEVSDYQAYAGLPAPISFNGLVRHYYLRAGGEVADMQVNLVGKRFRKEQSHAIVTRLRPALARIAATYGARLKVAEVPPGPPVLSPIVAEVYGPDADGRTRVAQAVRQVFKSTAAVVDVDETVIDPAPRKLLRVLRGKAALIGAGQEEIVAALRAGLAGESVTYIRDETKYPAATRLQLPVPAQADLDDALQLVVHTSHGASVPVRELVSVENSLREQPLYHKDLLPVVYVTGDVSGGADSPLYGMFAMRAALGQLTGPGGERVGEYFVSQPADPYRRFSVKWDGEWQITFETFRDMGAAYAVGLILIYLLVVAQFGSYLTPLVIMAPIPLTIIGVMPGHALVGAQFTATSMIGMIALAGIIVRNSILLVDFIRLEVASGAAFKDSVVRAAIVRAQPIALTAAAAMLGAFFILDDPIFNGLAVSLIFGILVSTALTLLVIPLLYYTVYRRKYEHPLEESQ